jgi:hypothetical protein
MEPMVVCGRDGTCVIFHIAEVQPSLNQYSNTFIEDGVVRYTLGSTEVVRLSKRRAEPVLFRSKLTWVHSETHC